MKGWKGLLWMVIPFAVLSGCFVWIVTAYAAWPRFRQFGLFWPFLWRTLWYYFWPVSVVLPVLFMVFCVVRIVLHRKRVHTRGHMLFSGVVFLAFTASVYLPVHVCALSFFGYPLVKGAEVSFPFVPIKTPPLIYTPALIVSMMISILFCFIIWLTDRLLLRKITPAAGA